LSEGVDIPELDGIAFIDPKKSQVDIIQAVGRAIRKSSEKKIGTIIIPVYLGETENIEEELFNSRFKDVWKIILALKSQDDYLTEVIDKMRVDLGSNRFNQNDLKKIIFDMPQKLNPRFSKALKPLLVKNTSESWIENYGRLKEFFEKNGHSVIPQKEFLGKWISTQRQEFKKNKISKYRIEKLNKLNFIWDQKENDWFVNYETIKGFIKEGIDLSKLDKKSSLSYWIGSQRFRYRKQKIEKDRLELLNKINFPFNPIDENWDEKFEKYKQLSNKYQDMGNHPKIRQSILGVWISTQRESFKKGKLSKERLEKLNSVNFIFDVSLNHWTAQFKKLKDFLKDNDWKDLDPKLQSWCNSLRAKKRKGKLKANQRILLESLGIDWDPVNNSWGEYYEKLKIFKEEEGHLDIPSKHEIGIWVVNQRKLFKENKISDVRVKLLDDIGFVWDTQKYRWQQNFQKLREKGLNSKVGNQDPILRNWKAKQRLMYKRGELSRNKIELLESIGFNWNPEEDDWYSKFEELISFKKINGHLNVPQRGTPLGTWVSSQRKSKSSGTINNKKVELLESIGFMWNVNDAEWKDTYTKLKKYLDKNENSYPPSNSPLGIKISSLRKSYKLGRLSNEKVQLLNSLNFIWNQKDYDWKKKVYEYKSLIEKNNYDAINFNKYPSLQTWISNIRSRFNAGSLTKNQIDDLNAINFVWDHKEYMWEQNFKNLLIFINKNGHARPTEKENRKLNVWISTQRADYKENKISKDRFNKLNDIQEWLWDCRN
ncbi:Helicase associated domain protein, partial [Prochlorococcus sp. AH-736-D21]|nr:Helicase associated domain protein [Prochlorococcus sp. AH-736-D21]